MGLENLSLRIYDGGLPRSFLGHTGSKGLAGNLVLNEMCPDIRKYIRSGVDLDGKCTIGSVATSQLQEPRTVPSAPVRRIANTLLPGPTQCSPW